MALIKHSNTRDIARDAVVLDLGDLQRQAALIMQSARDQASAVIAAAKAEREQILAGAAELGKSAGFEVGRAAGLNIGKEDGRTAAISEFRARLEAIESSWGSELSAFERARQSMLLAAEKDVLRLALQIAERVVKRAVANDPLIVIDQLRAVLAVVARPTELVVRIHPDDVEIVREALPQLTRHFTTVRNVELAEDQNLSRGSCIAAMRSSSGGDGRFAGGEIDASIATQLDRIVQALMPGGLDAEKTTS